MNSYGFRAGVRSSTCTPLGVLGGEVPRGVRKLERNVALGKIEHASVTSIILHCCTSVVEVLGDPTFVGRTAVPSCRR